jgi:hypothetical protein
LLGREIMNREKRRYEIKERREIREIGDKLLKIF